MRKVYCKNCRYNKRIYGIVASSTRCKHPYNISWDKDHYEPSIHYHISQRSLNRHNDCKLYKRKWWEFWVIKMDLQDVLIVSSIICIILGLICLLIAIFGWWYQCVIL